MGAVLTLTLHLGVVDVPYVHREPPAKQRARLAKNAARPKAKPTHAEADEKTTGDVATILEAKYGIMEAFFENKEAEVVGALEESLGGVLEDVLSGAAPASVNPFGAGCAKIEESFKDFLSSREAETIGIDGVPTEAARRGVNHRKKHPYAKANVRRPSFIDTGLYQASMKAWVD